MSARQSNHDEWGLSRPLEARLIGPNFISTSNCSYRKINRASDHAAVEETQSHTNRLPLDGRGGVIMVEDRWKRLREGLHL